MTTLAHLALSQKMLDTRDTLRRFASHGGKPWPEMIRGYMDALQERHDETGEAVLAIAARAAKSATDQGKPMVDMSFVAAAVELLDPSPQGATP